MGNRLAEAAAATGMPVARPEWLARGRQVMEIEIAALQRARDALDGAFEQAVAVLLTAVEGPGKIVVTGVGKSLHIAEKVAATLASTGSPSVLLNPTQALHGDLGMVGTRDVLLALSFSGESEELLALVPAVRRLGVPIVALTGHPASSLAVCSDVVVPIAIDREACPFNMAPTASTTATLAVGDALAMVLLEARGFQREDYARLHPAGAIGRALLTRVQDIMRTGERLAQVVIGASVEQALLAMTRTKSGSACVVDADGRLRGIFTDGDLRRNLARVPNILQAPIRDLMSTDPVRVRQDLLAVDVLRLFETHKIDDLPVVDGGDRLTGCIDIQDLPRFKIL